VGRVGCGNMWAPSFCKHLGGWPGWLLPVPASWVIYTPWQLDDKSTHCHCYLIHSLTGRQQQALGRLRKGVSSWGWKAEQGTGSCCWHPLVLLSGGLLQPAGAQTQITMELLRMSVAGYTEL